MDQADAENTKQEVDLFYRQSVTAAAFRQLANNNNLSFDESTVDGPGRFAASPMLSYIEQSMAVGGAVNELHLSGDVVIGEAANRRAEVEGIAPRHHSALS